LALKLKVTFGDGTRLIQSSGNYESCRETNCSSGKEDATELALRRLWRTRLFWKKSDPKISSAMLVAMTRGMLKLCVIPGQVLT
jgi:hypothetical protein